MRRDRTHTRDIDWRTIKNRFQNGFLRFQYKTRVFSWFNSSDSRVTRDFAENFSIWAWLISPVWILVWIVSCTVMRKKSEWSWVEFSTLQFFEKLRVELDMVDTCKGPRRWNGRNLNFLARRSNLTIFKFWHVDRRLDAQFFEFYLNISILFYFKHHDYPYSFLRRLVD